MYSELWSLSRAVPGLPCSTYFISGHPTWAAKKERGPEKGDEHLWFMYLWLKSGRRAWYPANMAPPAFARLRLPRKEGSLGFGNPGPAGGGGGESGNAGREAALCNLFGAARGGGGGWECRPGKRGILGIIAEKKRLLLLLYFSSEKGLRATRVGDG